MREYIKNYDNLKLVKRSKLPKIIEVFSSLYHYIRGKIDSLPKEYEDDEVYKKFNQKLISDFEDNPALIDAIEILLEPMDNKPILENYEDMKIIYGFIQKSLKYEIRNLKLFIKNNKYWDEFEKIKRIKLSYEEYDAFKLLDQDFYNPEEINTRQIIDELLM